MNRPEVSWNPARHINSALDGGYPSLEDCFTQAYLLGLRYVEVYHGLLPFRAPEMLRQLRKRLDRHELGVSTITCAPDFTQPDPQAREEQYRDMIAMIEVARALGAAGLRVTAGCEHAEVSREDGVIWCAELLMRLADAAERAGIEIGLENHYRDRRWTSNDFAFQTDVFLEVFDRIKDSPIGIVFNTSNPLMTADDPMTILEVVKHKVWRVRASDRFPGQHGHTVIGEGAVDFDPIFECLSGIGYDGFISLEDSNSEGDAGLERGLRFVRGKVAQWWR